MSYERHRNQVPAAAPAAMALKLASVEAEEGSA